MTTGWISRTNVYIHVHVYSNSCTGFRLRYRHDITDIMLKVALNTPNPQITYMYHEKKTTCNDVMEKLHFVKKIFEKKV
jgi:hypothetical protein